MSHSELSASGAAEVAPLAENESSGPAARRVRAAYALIEELERPEIWISLRSQADALMDAERIDAAVARGEELPLAGTVIAVKDNIDVAGFPTTAGCPAYAYEPETTAPAVERLVAAGAVVLGKTNLDQFATGLVGTRSPYGVVRNAAVAGLVAGGSSSGSAVAVALGIVDFGIGTDTAGSGRIPAAFNGVVGIKPTIGLVPTGGVVPASRSFDCVSVFAASVAGAETALDVMVGAAPERAWPASVALGAPADVAVAVPAGRLPGLSEDWAELFELAIRRLEAGGAKIVPIEIEPFLEGARLLYESALVAERYAAVGPFVDANPASVDPTVASIIGEARGFAAHEFVRDVAQLEDARGRAMAVLSEADVLLLPTAPEHPTIEEVAADPVGVNRRLGRYASFANLFDLTAVSVPAGDKHGYPFGVTVFARAFGERVAADVARRIAGEPAASTQAIGAPGHALMVIGAHLSGQPLNRELTSRGARLIAPVRTEQLYRMFALPTTPAKPGLQHVGAGGASVEGELWLMPPAGLGSLLASLPEPMTLGRVSLDDGTQVTGFFCQASATEGAADISHYGGWRNYLGRES
ncbi:MAG TPA: allophanate hydrolase [Gaiellaceae bacterium]|nr:allophanate hydrolase [Gaiellaceae bacterium]